jgi:hypothetical protein
MPLRPPSYLSSQPRYRGPMEVPFSSYNPYPPSYNPGPYPPLEPRYR